MFYKNLFVYITPTISYEEKKIKIEQINNYVYPKEEFILKIKEKQFEINEKDMELYCVFGTFNEIAHLKEKISKELNALAQSIIKTGVPIRPKKDKSTESEFLDLFIFTVLKDDSFKYPRMFELHKNDLYCLCLYVTKNPEENKEKEVENAIHLFLEYENPTFMGKQIMINSFLLQNINNRKILAVMPSPDGWYALLEGGLKLYLNVDNSQNLEKIGSNDVGMFTTLEIDSMLHNPIYAYKKFFTPYELFENWSGVFLYLLATLPINYSEDALKNIYNDFMQFIENNICEAIPADEAIIKEDDFIKVLFIQINTIRDYIKGLEETEISKNLLLLVKNKHIYFEPLNNIIEKYYLKEVLSQNNPSKFLSEEWSTLLKQVEIGKDNYRKGLALEEAASYFINCIKGLKITGKRVKTENEEIDLVCCNVSQDSTLWELGTIILAECKNWQSKIEAKIVRNLAFLMEKKGVNSILLFTKKGITKGAQLEINKCAAHNKYILVFSLDDLYHLNDKKTSPYDLLISKINTLKDETLENSVMEMIM